MIGGATLIEDPPPRTHSRDQTSGEQANRRSPPRALDVGRRPRQRLGSFGNREMGAVPLQIFRRPTIAASGMPFEIDLRDHGAEDLVSSVRGCEEGMSCLRNHTRRASPFHNKQDLVGELREHSRLRNNEEGRAVQDNEVIGAPKGVDEVGKSVSCVQQQRLAPI